MTTHRSLRIRTAALIGGGVVAGVIGASALGASAQTTTTSTTTPTSVATAPATAKTDGHSHGDEATVTGTKANTLKANALKQVPGATINRITTEDTSDSSKAAYEVHLTKTDGTHQTLLFASDLSYLSTQTSTGHGHDGAGHGGNGETAVTGADATTLKTAALKQVPGATVDEVTTDSGDAAYEVHLTKADGSDVTVKFDKSLKFLSVEDGRGK